VIKYLGSKRVLLPKILAAVRALGRRVRTVLDPFSGTARVGHALKAAGYRVLASDHNRYAEVLARCLVQADADDVAAPAERLLAELNALPGRAGWFTETYCERSRYFQPKNGARIEAIRERIAALSLEPELEAVLLTSLLLAADRVDSTTGVQMAFLKEWAPRAHRELELRLPPLLRRARAGKGVALSGDALAIAQDTEADVVYLDPPYNQHSYLGNYHVWETLVRWDRPAVFGVACKRTDVQQRKSEFNSRQRCRDALAALVATVRARYVVLSFNDEGYLSPGDLEAILATRGEVMTLSFDHPRYVGARIGIYSPKGEKVGTPGRLRNRELLYVAGGELPQGLRAAAGTVT
jgi:adenine-specific DNA-methyltransferase